MDWSIFSTSEIEAFLPDAFRAIDLLGVLCNGVIGGRLARRKGFDLVGFAVLAVMSALGGGMLRDMMLNTVPVAITDPYYLSTALTGALIAFLWKMESKWSSRIILMADAVVLGTWAATGTLKTLQYGHGVMAALLLGVITAVGGGMIRDIASGSVPMVFGGNYLYATPGFMSAVTMVISYHAGLPMIGMALATLVAAAVALISHWRKWYLPTTQDWPITVSAQQLAGLLRRASIRATPTVLEAIRRSASGEDDLGRGENGPPASSKPEVTQPQKPGISTDHRSA